MILPKSQPTWKLSKKMQETTESQPLSAAGDLRSEATQATVLQRGKPRSRAGTTTGSGPHVGGSAMCEGVSGPRWPLLVYMPHSQAIQFPLALSTLPRCQRTPSLTQKNTKSLRFFPTCFWLLGCPVPHPSHSHIRQNGGETVFNKLLHSYAIRTEPA